MVTFGIKKHLCGHVAGPGRNQSRLGFSFTLVLALAWTLAGCGDPKDIETLKNGNLDMCPGFTLGTIISGSMKRVRWESVAADGGSTQVNIIGIMSVGRKPVTARLEFIVNESADSYRFGAFKLDDVVQEDYNVATLLSSMCELVGGGPAAGQPSKDGE